MNTQATRRPCLTFTDEEGRTFTARLLMPGARYGLHNALSIGGPDSPAYDPGTHPRIEFFDGADVDGDEPLGQFTGGRYYVFTLLDHSPHHGLCLHGGVPEWTVGPQGLRKVLCWLAGTPHPLALPKPQMPWRGNPECLMSGLHLDMGPVPHQCIACGVSTS